MPRSSEGNGPRQSRPATTPEGRESQLVALAFDLVEKRIRSGNATSQEVTHFLKLGSSREKLEQERIRHENDLMEIKREAIASQSQAEERYKQALDAMRAYTGQDPLPDAEEFDD